MANWNVYIPQKYEIGLQALALEGESIGQVIKRLVLGILDGDNPSAIAAPSPDALAEIQERLEKLEAQSGDRQNDDLTQISYRLELLERDLDAKGDRLSDLSTRLHQMELFLSDRPTLPPALPKKEMPQGLTHKEIAAAIGSSERTMQRVAKDKERWPEGYHWSEESKKWFLLEV
jgi:uncharacterized coiled-coil protein SlyX